MTNTPTFDPATDPWKQTYTGKAFPLLNPAPEDVDWEDIAFHLAHINRFAGACGPYSVAQHSVLVADLMPFPWRVYGLLHDAHEAYTGDITSPMKLAMEADYDDVAQRCSDTALSPLETIRGIQRGIDIAIYAKAGLTFPTVEIKNAVKEADLKALYTERRDMMKPAPYPWGLPSATPSRNTVYPWSAHSARIIFLEELRNTGCIRA